MKQNETKYLKCILNADDAPFSVGQDEVINAENVRFGSTDSGVINTVESIGSTTRITPFAPSISTVVIGSADDTQNNRILYFVADLYGNDDKIMCYSIDTLNIYTVLQGSQVIGGLNFDKNSVIHSARVVNGLLFWTDYLNQPRRININAGINLNQPGTFPNVDAYTAPMTAEVLTIIRKPPAYPINFLKTTDPDIKSNQVKNNSFKFSYFYTYRDGEKTTLSPRSLVANYNYKEDAFNSITLSIPFSEIPDQDVEIVSIVVIYGNDTTGFTIKTWDKKSPTEAAEIAAHVAGSAALTYYFRNDSVGESIDAATLSKPFDSVPLLSETLEQATNRLFLGRNLLGYNTPISDSLTAQVVQTGSDTVSGFWVEQPEQVTGGTCLQWYWYFAYFATDIDGSHPAGYYDLTADPLHWNNNTCSGTFFPPIAFISTINIADYTRIGGSTADIQTYVAAHDSSKVGGTVTSRLFGPLSVTLYGVYTTAGGVQSNISILKSDSPYRLGRVFYDQYLRQCGVVKGPKVTTPDRGYSDFATYNYGIQWDLPAGVQLEIPDWAYYYSIVITKALRPSFFIQSRASEIVYATKDADGNYIFTELSYNDSNAGVAVKLDLLIGTGQGYSYQEGDIIKIYLNTIVGSISLSVIAQVGSYLIGELYNFGSLVGLKCFFEIYTPVPQNAAEVYYENGKMYPVINPTRPDRQYSTITDTISGDVYLLSRGTSPDQYLTENMSPNSTYWKNWYTNAGRIQVVDSIGQRFKNTSVKWSNTFIPGTITNGLSSFDALDEKILPGEMGPLRKLQITSKVNNEQGSVMLAICEDETASMYLGEVQLVGATSNVALAQATDVIGTVNILKGSYGTVNPESVVEFRGTVFFVDLQNGKVIQYSANPLFPISEYKTTRFWKLFSDQFLSMSKAQIEALGNRPFIFTTVDPHHEELLISVPRLLVNPPKGYLPDYPSRVYPFDIWDGQAKTIVYKLYQEPNHWQGAYKFCSEGFIYIENKLFSFKNGQLYLHNSLTSQCNFYGVQEKARIMCLSNSLPQVPKSYNNLSIQGNLKPSFVYMYSDTPYQQCSDLIDSDFSNKEGIFYSTIYRNKLVPTSSGLSTNGLLTGEKVRTDALNIMLEFDVSTQRLDFKFINIGYSISHGHAPFIK